MKPINIAVVAPIHNRKEETLRCLASLFQTDRTGINLRIIIVDDGSTDGSAETIRTRFPSIELVPGDGTLWYTAGTNRGITTALSYEPKYVLAINDDSIFDENCIRALVD